MKLKYILIYGNLIFVLNVTAQINSADQVRIDSLFEQWNNKDSPGAAIGIIENGKLIYTRGYGMADLEHDIPITASSVFYLGSVSKQFVTMCILLLEEQGKLNLDDEIQLYLPDFPKYQAPLTIRHFIHHTSGVRDNLTLWELAGNDLLDHIDDDAIYQLIKRQKILNFTPGDKYLYSNSCYFMLAMIVEKASDLPIKEFADKNIFIPLGMKNSHFHDNHYHIIKNRVFSYSRVDGGYNNLIMRFDLVGSGGLYSNINDLFLWDQNFYDNKLGKRKAQLVQKMHEEGILNSGESSHYAFGIRNGTYRGLKTVSHGGSLAGYRTYLLRFPEQNFSVIILANVSDFNRSSSAYGVADILLKNEFKNEMAVETKGEQISVTPVKLTTEKLEKFCASYWNYEQSYSRKIYLKNDTLRHSRSDNNENQLLPISKNEFKMLGVEVDIKVKFVNNDNNQQTMLVTIDDGKPINSIAYKPVSYSIDELKNFVGAYYSDELNSSYDLRIKDDALLLYVNGKEISALKPVMKNLFINSDFGTFTFKEGSTGNIAAVSLDAGRVRNLNFIRK